MDIDYEEYYIEFRTLMTCHGFSTFTRFAAINCIWGSFKITFVEASQIFQIFADTGLVKRHKDIWTFNNWD